MSKKQKIVISVYADDHPGILKVLSDTALEHKANWLDSSLSHLCGHFAGLVQLEISSEHKSKLIDAFEALATQGIQASVRPTGTTPTPDIRKTVELYVEANDRPGIVEEIASTLSARNINIEQLESWRESASMAGYQLFIAQLAVSLPNDMDVEQLETALEAVSNDLIVSLNID